MKKTLATVLVSAMVIGLAGCGASSDNTAAESTTEAATEAVTEAVTEASTEEAAEEATTEAAADEKSEGVMTYAEYVAADVDTEVTIETYIQAKQGWWENEGVGVATFYTQDQDGGYFLYNMPCSEEEYNDELTVGTKIKVTGYKSEWSGEVEITDATFEVEEGEYTAEPADVTDLLGSDELTDYMNQYVAVNDLTVAASTDADGNEVAYLYNYDGSGSQGDDLYFNVTAGDETYTFTVESYLCGSDTDVYKAVEGLNVGDTIDIEGFLYWYNGAQPHVTSVTVK